MTAEPLHFQIKGAKPLSLQMASAHAQGDLTFRTKLDQQCAFPLFVEATREDGSLAMLAERKECIGGQGEALAMAMTPEAANKKNPAWKPAGTVLAPGATGSDFRPAHVRLGDILDIVREYSPDSCKADFCQVGWLRFEHATRPNLTILNSPIGETKVERWSLCIRSNAWKQVTVDWNESDYWVEDAGSCPYNPPHSLKPTDMVLDLHGIEQVLPRFSAENIWYEIRPLPDPQAPQILAVARPQPQNEAETTSIQPFPLFWSSEFDGYIAQATWPTRLKIATDAE